MTNDCKVYLGPIDMSQLKGTVSLFMCQDVVDIVQE